MNNGHASDSRKDVRTSSIESAKNKSFTFTSMRSMLCRIARELQSKFNGSDEDLPNLVFQVDLAFDAKTQASDMIGQLSEFESFKARKSGGICAFLCNFLGTMGGRRASLPPIYWGQRF